MSDSNIRQQEHTLLCACFENLCRTFLATIAATPGDFGVVETSTADLLVHLRKALVEGGLRLSCVCAPHDYICPACDQAVECGAVTSAGDVAVARGVSERLAATDDPAQTPTVARAGQTVSEASRTTFTLGGLNSSQLVTRTAARV